MAAVVHDYLRFNTATLQSLIDRVMDMIEEYRHSDIAGIDNIQTIDMYASELSTQEDRFKQLNEKVDAFIKKSNNKGIETDSKLNTESQNASIFKIELQETSKLNIEPQDTSIFKSPILKPVCLVCGKLLSKNGMDVNTNSQKLLCDKRFGGCGKHYLQKDGILESSKGKGRPKVAIPESEIGQVKTISSSLPIEVPIKEKVPIEVIQENYIIINAPKIIEYFENNKEITNSTVRDLCGLDTNKAKYLLQTLVKKNFIRKIGYRKDSKYVLVEGSDSIGKIDQ